MTTDPKSQAAQETPAPVGEGKQAMSDPQKDECPWEPGMEVTICSQYGARALSSARIDRLTATQVVLDECDARYSRATGRLLGGSSYIRPTTDADRDGWRRASMLGTLFELTMPRKACEWSTAKIERVLAAIRSGS
jgi:hypothetical protein